MRQYRNFFKDHQDNLVYPVLKYLNTALKKCQALNNYFYILFIIPVTYQIPTHTIKISTLVMMQSTIVI